MLSKHQRDLSYPNGLNLLTGNNSRSTSRPLASHSHVTTCFARGEALAGWRSFLVVRVLSAGPWGGAPALWSGARPNSVWNVNGLIFISLPHARGGPRCHSMPRVIIRRRLSSKKIWYIKKKSRHATASSGNVSLLFFYYFSVKFININEQNLYNPHAPSASLPHLSLFL